MKNEEEVREKLAAIEACKAAGERAYDRMYDVRDRAELMWQTEVATDAYREAYRIADELGLREQASEIMDRLRHVKAVSRQLG
jgi:hypothetical protein